MTDQKKKLNSAITREIMGKTERVEFMIASYWKAIAGALLLAVLLIAGTYWGCSSHSAAQRRAATALSDAKTVAELQSALKMYESAPGASFARFRLASLLTAEKKYDEALELLKQVSMDSENPALAAQAALNVAYLYELAGKTGDATGKFYELGRQTGFPELLRAEANFNTARLYAVAGQLDLAVEAIRRIPKSNDSQIAVWSQHGESLLIAIENNEYGKYNAGKQ